MADLEEMNERMFKAINSLMNWIFSEYWRLKDENKMLRKRLENKSFDELIDKESE